MWDRGYDQMVAEIKARFGFELELYNTGGWCMVYEARLEGNAVIWISDYDAGITPRDERLVLEGKGITGAGMSASTAPMTTAIPTTPSWPAPSTKPRWAPNCPDSSPWRWSPWRPTHNTTSPRAASTPSPTA